MKTPIGTRLSYFASQPILATSWIGAGTALSLSVLSSVLLSVLFAWTAIQFLVVVLQLAAGGLLVDAVLKVTARSMIRVARRA